MVFGDKVSNLFKFFRLLDGCSIVCLDLTFASEVLHNCGCLKRRGCWFGDVNNSGYLSYWVVVDLYGDCLIVGVCCEDIV